MSVKKNPAFILFTRSVHFEHSPDLYLVSQKEGKDILQTMEIPEQVGAGQFILEGTTPNYSLAEILEKHAGTNISIVHISGTLQQITVTEQNEIARILGQYTQLKVVFLSGCGSLSFIKSLLLKDIPAVIATHYSLPNSAATDLSQSFYQQLSEGKSLRESFDHITEHFDGVGYYRSHYEFEYDQLKWENFNEVEISQSIPWGLYILKDHITQLNWRFPHTDRLIQMIPPKKEPEPEKINPNYQFYAILTAVLLIGITSAFFIYSLWNQEGIPQSGCPFPESTNGMTTLMLPTFNLDTKKMDKKGFNGMFKKHLSDVSLGNELYTDFKEIKDPSNIFLAIDRYVIECQTDLMLWGEYRAIDKNHLRFRMNFVIPEFQADSLIHGSYICTLSKNLKQKNNEDAIKDLFYSAFGTALYEKKLYRNALGMFDKVSMKNDTLYSNIAFKIAQSYAHLDILDTAENYYSHVIKIMPDWEAAYNGRGSVYAREQKFEEAIRDYNYATAVAKDFTEAYYNRGLVHYKLEQYQASREDMIKVLELRPSHAEATGIIAATFAVEQNEDSFYYYLEEALKKGIDIEKLKRYTDVGSYQADSRFRSLMSKY